MVFLHRSLCDVLLGIHPLYSTTEPTPYQLHSVGYYAKLVILLAYRVDGKSGWRMRNTYFESEIERENRCAESM